MAVQWGLGTGNNALAMFGQGVQLGQNIVDRREARDQRNSLLDLHQQQEARLLQEQQRTQAQQDREQRRAGVADIAKLFEGVTPENYGQRIGIAQQLGIDVSGVPQQFDPAWVDEQRAVFQFFADKEDDLPGIAQELVAAGYQPGTPEFADAMRGVINSKYASDYVDEQGNTRRRSVLNLGGAQGGPQPGMVEDGYRFKGGNPADPSAWEPVAQGGPQVAPAAGFPGN